MQKPLTKGKMTANKLHRGLRQISETQLQAGTRGENKEKTNRK